MTSDQIAICGLIVTIIGTIISCILFRLILLNEKRVEINQGQFNDLKLFMIDFIKRDITNEFNDNKNTLNNIMEDAENNLFNCFNSGSYNKFINMAYERSGLNPNIARSDAHWYINKNNRELHIRFTLESYREFVSRYRNAYERPGLDCNVYIDNLYKLNNVKVFQKS